MSEASAVAKTSVGSGGIDSSTRNQILDLGTSDKAVLELIQTKFGNADLNSRQQSELQLLFSTRQQQSSLISNLLRASFETLSNIVRNIRG